MLNKYKRKKVALLLAITSCATIFTIFFLSESGLLYANRVVALVNNERIYESDIKDRLSEIFPGSDPRTIKVSTIPGNIIDPISRSIYARKKLLKKAKLNMIHKEQSIKDNIDRYAKRLIIEKYIDLAVNQKVSKKALREKYLEMSDEIKDDKEFGISHILVKTEFQADKILEKSNSGESFSSLVQKYSLDRATNRKKGNLGYFKQKDIQEEFADAVLSLKENEVAGPIETKKGWHIVKLYEIKMPELEDFDKIEAKMRQELRKSEKEHLFANLANNATVKLLINQ